jgi:hypothetical protein
MSRTYDAMQDASYQREAGEIRPEADEGAQEIDALARESSGTKMVTAETSETAVVPVAETRPGPLARFLLRVASVAPGGSATLYREVSERLDRLEMRLAAQDEQISKRLEEGEGRTLQLLEQRLRVHEEELAGSLRRLARREARAAYSRLRTRLALLALLVLAASAVGTVALIAVRG